MPRGAAQRLHQRPAAPAPLPPPESRVPRSAKNTSPAIAKGIFDADNASMDDLPRRLGAEFFGTFCLTFAGRGSVVLAADPHALGIGFLGQSLCQGSPLAKTHPTRTAEIRNGSKCASGHFGSHASFDSCSTVDTHPILDSCCRSDTRSRPDSCPTVDSRRKQVAPHNPSSDRGSSTALSASVSCLTRGSHSAISSPSLYPRRQARALLRMTSL